MELSGDEIAGVVDLFGALTRAELGRALVELAFKRGEDAEPAAFDPEIFAALESYRLVRLEPGALGDGTDEPLLTPGPAAFPSLPEGARDLQHILDVEERDVDREATGEAAAKRLRNEAQQAIEDGDTETAATLIEVSYDVEAWAAVDLAETRERLDEIE